MRPISFNIYRMKVNDKHFSSGTAIIHFWDKALKDTNFKSHSHRATLFKLGKYCQIAHAPFDFISFYLFMLTFAMKLKDTNYKSHWNNLAFCDQWKMMSYFNMSHGKMSDFVSFPLVWFTLVIKLRISTLKVIEIL